MTTELLHGILPSFSFAITFFDLGIYSLDLQHFLIQQQIGHLLHPSINLPKENCKIADIGAGTW